MQKESQKLFCPLSLISSTIAQYCHREKCAWWVAISEKEGRCVVVELCSFRQTKKKS